MSSLQALRGGADAPDAGMRAARPQTATRKTKALLVEDDHNSRFALNVLLERAGIEVVAATNGAAALQSLKHTPDVDIVLMDIMMPIMDGYETMTAMRNIPTCREIPIIAVTAKAAEGERSRCLAAGASDYIPKPVNAAQLIGAIGHWLPDGGDAQA
jgi:CheY-like chemotaxis protein